MKPSKRFFHISLGVLTVILLVYGILRWKIGIFLPEIIDKNLPDAVMVGAVAIMLWNRKLRNDEDKAAAERKKLEEDAAAAKPVEAEAPVEGPSTKGEGGADAPD